MEWILDRCAAYANAPQTLDFPKMALLCGDREEPLFEGQGTISFPDFLRTEYSIKGRPRDLKYTIGQLRRQKANPYKPLLRFRLVATDKDGLEIAGGWTVPDYEIGSSGEWVFSGECEGLIFDIEDSAGRRSPRTEALYLIPRVEYAWFVLNQFVSRDDEARGKIPEREVLVGGEPVSFRFYADSGSLYVATAASAQFPLTFTESWLGEPLRVLFGQLIYPRMIARIKPNGQAMIRVSRTLPWSPRSNWAALWRGKHFLKDRDGFWSLYGDFLQYIATQRDSAGHPNHEPNRITQLYGEVIQAAHGSRWVWALTFASVIEGLAKILEPRGTKDSNADGAVMESLIGYIKKWPGKDDRLKGIAVNAIRRTAEVTPKRTLTKLTTIGRVSRSQIEIWEGVRNAVAHGELISPYSNEEDDSRLLALSDMMHGVTRAILEEYHSSRANGPSLLLVPYGFWGMSPFQ